MNLYRKLLCLSILFWAFTQVCSAYTIIQVEADTTLPKVFLIGEHEVEYEEVIQEHGTLLFSACDMEMELAYSKWVSMLEEIEIASENFGLDLKGVKIWLNVFWENDGTIAHLAYYLKPISRNVDVEQLELFFLEFIESYKFPLNVDTKYSHYGTASFPVFAKVIQSNGGQGNVTKGE